jgi:acyl-ACP thioesterase
MYQKKYYIGSNDVDQFLDLKLPSFFRLMQDIATEHAEVLDIGKANTLDKGLYWVITRIELDIIKMPKYLQTVTLKTYPGDDLRFIFPRYFQLEDEKGNILIKASSTWMVLNKESHRICLNPFEGKRIPPEHYEGEQPLPTKVISDSDISLVENRKVRYSDIDLNGHLNNTKYIDYIIDLHDSEFYKKHRISHFLINYEKEMKDNDVLDVYRHDGNKEYIKGEINGATVFEVNIDYLNR